MSTGKAISDHYVHGDLLSATEIVLHKLGNSSDNVIISDLAPVDEFHIGAVPLASTLLNNLTYLF